jgi:hypothetical protein
VLVAETRRVIEIELPSGDSAPVVCRRFGTGQTRVVITAGIRGDAPEGIRVAHRVAAFLEQQEARLNGTVDIYPCANPLAAHRGTRTWPFFDTDLNRLFPGRVDGHPPAQVARALCNDISGARQVIELRGARPAFSEASQAIVRHDHEESAELATHANVAVVWRRTPGPAAPATFAHQFPGSIVLEGGTGNRLTAGVGNDLADGVLNLLVHLKVLPEDDLPFHWAAIRRPVQVTDAQVHRVRAQRGGLFLPASTIWSAVAEGDPLGEVVDPLTGLTREVVQSPVAGNILAIRELPVVFPGTMVARVVTP